MTRNPPKDPLIAIIGATGTGKSQLAVEVAKRYNGEIINGDAMQLYAGLPILTNKITEEEQQGIPHHLLGCIGLEEPTWVVGTFVKNALKTIDGIRSRGKLPILVGGTHYYLQSLLFKDNFSDASERKEESTEYLGEAWPILKEPTSVILSELRRVDPVMADRWHPNDRRKIQRSLQIYLQTGRKASEVYTEQRKLIGTRNRSNAQETDAILSDGPAMRFPTLVFWVHADTDTLKGRLDKRVDNMIEHGMLAEVEHLNHLAAVLAEAGKPADETRGIWVSIGYKEYNRYLKLLTADEIDEKNIDRQEAEALEMIKAATRKYAKRQIRWIRIKLINALAQANASPSLYLLDGSDISAFDDNVVNPALELAGDFLTASNPLPAPASLSPAAAEMLAPKRDYDLAATPERWIRESCDVCGVTCVTEDQWNQHVTSKAHKKLVSKRRKAADATQKQEGNQRETNSSKQPNGLPPSG